MCEYGSQNKEEVHKILNMKQTSAICPYLLQLQFAAYETNVAYLLNTTDDNVVETPDESLTVAIYVAGMFPSFLGDLIATVTIEVRRSSRIAARVHRQQTGSSVKHVLSSCAGVSSSLLGPCLIAVPPYFSHDSAPRTMHALLE